MISLYFFLFDVWWNWGKGIIGVWVCWISRHLWLLVMFNVIDKRKQKNKLDYKKTLTWYSPGPDRLSTAVTSPCRSCKSPSFILLLHFTSFSHFQCPVTCSRTKNLTFVQRFLDRPCWGLWWLVTWWREWNWGGVCWIRWGGLSGLRCRWRVAASRGGGCCWNACGRVPGGRVGGGRRECRRRLRWSSFSWERVTSPPAYLTYRLALRLYHISL